MLKLERLRAMHDETTDPMAARLLGEILVDVEAAVGLDQTATADEERDRS